METDRRTPGVSLQKVFLRALSGGIEDAEGHGEAVAEALGYLQQGFEAHYAAAEAADDEILVGDSAYAWAVETIARLDEPGFVAVASRMIRDGAGEISAGRSVTIELWTPHLARLLSIISGEENDESERRVRSAVEEVRGGTG